MLVVTMRFTHKTAIGQQQDSTIQQQGSNTTLIATSKVTPVLPTPLWLLRNNETKKQLAATLLMISTCHRDQQHRALDIIVVSM